MKKCVKVKNPCKICLETVTTKIGLQCKGACKKWVHFTCLGYTPGKIKDIKDGTIIVTCPCPTCNVPADQKEYIAPPPIKCDNEKCPLGAYPKCDLEECPVNNPARPIPERQEKCKNNCSSSKTMGFPDPAVEEKPLSNRPCFPNPRQGCCPSNCQQPPRPSCPPPPKCPPPCPPPPKCPPPCPPPPCEPPPAEPPCLSAPCTPPPCPPPQCPPPPCPPPPCQPPPCQPPQCQLSSCPPPCRTKCFPCPCPNSCLYPVEDNEPPPDAADSESVKPPSRKQEDFKLDTVEATGEEKAPAVLKSASCSCLCRPRPKSRQEANEVNELDEDGIDTRTLKNGDGKSNSDSMMGSPNLTEKTLLCTIRQLCSTVGHLSSNIKDLMCKMIVNLEK